MMKQMDTRGKVINCAFAVSAAFALGDHLGFAAANMNAMIFPMIVGKLIGGVTAIGVAMMLVPKDDAAGENRSGGAIVNTRQLLSVGIDIGTTTTQVIFAPRSWLTVRRCRRCRATNSSNATLAGKARSSLRPWISRAV